MIANSVSLGGWRIARLIGNIPMHKLKKLMAPYGGLPSVVACLTKVEALRDYGTNSHEKRVGRMVESLCRELEIDADLRGAIVGAGMLHDIGKFAIPLDVIQKAGPLTREEVALLKTHSEKGYEILTAASDSFMNFAADLSLTHHERYDGTGYPRGLKGDEIPIGAAILALCDVYDALRQDRPYRRGMTHNKAADIILVGDGRTRPEHFSPDVLAAFRSILPRLKAIYASDT
jgi:putative two-component system response regulator